MRQSLRVMSHNSQLIMLPPASLQGKQGSPEEGRDEVALASGTLSGLAQGFPLRCCPPPPGALEGQVWTNIYFVLCLLPLPCPPWNVLTLKPAYHVNI